MADLTITNESKNNVTITNASKVQNQVTWADTTYSWDASRPSTWDLPRVPLTKLNKTNVTITNVSKN